MDNAHVRAMHRGLEPFHGMIYFVPESPAACSELGVQGRSGYFALRSAAMGQVNAEVVISTFFNFNPELIHAAFPAVWSVTTPEQLCEARLQAADAALRRVLGDAVDSPEMAEAAELARAATAGCYVEGHPLYAGHANRPWPTEPHMVLWWAQTLLREFRGDGHIAAMTTQGITGVEALVIHAATGVIPPETLQNSRGWSDEAWAAGQASVRERGWLTDSAELSEAGQAARQWVEDTTDTLAAPCWAELTEDQSARLLELTRPYVKALMPEFPGGGSWLKKP